MSAYQIVTIAPNREGKVSTTLSSLELPHYVFRVPRQVVMRGRLCEKQVPAFPGYVFVEAESAFEEVRKVIGIIDFVRQGGVVVAVGSELIERVLAACEARRLEPPQNSLYKLGDKVKISSFAFDCEGVFQRMIDAESALVLLDWMGRMVHCEVAISDISLDKIENQGISSRPKARRRRRRPGKSQRAELRSIRAAATSSPEC
jgi:transcription antitermination factor NusG